MGRNLDPQFSPAGGDIYHYLALQETDRTTAPTALCSVRSELHLLLPVSAVTCNATENCQPTKDYESRAEQDRTGHCSQAVVWYDISQNVVAYVLVVLFHI